MRIAAITNLAPNDVRALSSIHQRWGLVHVVQPDWSSRAPKPRSEKLNKLLRSPIATIADKLDKSHAKRRGMRRDRSLLHLLQEPVGASVLDVTRSSIPVGAINDRTTADLLRRVAPDILVTSSCPLLKSAIYGIPRLATINIHWGISQAYRGEDTVFWPLYFNDFAYIGVTIHKIDDGIDTGSILAQGSPGLSPADLEVDVVSKCATLAAGLLETVVAEFEARGAVEGTTLDRRGRLCRRRDRSFRHDAIYWLRRKFGFGRPAETEVRQRSCFQHSAPRADEAIQTVGGV